MLIDSNSTFIRGFNAGEVKRLNALRCGRIGGKRIALLI